MLRLCELGVEHPRRKKSGQSPVLETLWNDRVACLRFRRAERHMDSFAQTLRGRPLVRASLTMNFWKFCTASQYSVCLNSLRSSFSPRADLQGSEQ
jgi:hypothetical protein